MSFVVHTETSSESLFKMKPTRCTLILAYLFQLLYMFRATVCPSSEELTVSMRHWYISFCMGGCLICRLQSIFISTSLHVSGNYVPIIRRTYCIYATLVFFILYGWLSDLQAAQYIYFNFITCFGQLCAHHQENLLYLCICVSVWVAVGSAASDRTATHTDT